jgi:nitrogen fixation protein FixH
MVVSILVALLTVVTIVVGSRSFDGVVVEKPYEAGLAWDKTEQERTELGWNVSMENGPFRTGRNELVLTVADRDGKLIGDAELSIRVTRPSTTSLDRTYAAERQTDGRYHAPVVLAHSGNWEVLVRVRRGSASSEYTLQLYAERNPQ